MSQETPPLIWRTGRGYHRHVYHTRMKKFTPFMMTAEMEIKQNSNPFLIINLELKPGMGNVLSRLAPIHQSGIPQEVDSAPILRAFEQNHVPLSRH